MIKRRLRGLRGWAALCLACSLPVFAQDKSPPAATTQCTAEIRFTSAKSQATISDLLNANLFSSVSQPGSCLPAEIRITASFFDAEENLICSGVVEGVVTQTSNVQSSNLEFRPFNSLEFVRWRNGPRPTAVRPKRLFCMNVDGLAEAPVGDLERATSMRIHATVLPKAGGVSTAEYRVTFIARPN